MKRIVTVVAGLAFVLSALGFTVAAQHDGIPSGTPMAGEAQGMSMGAFYLTVTNGGDVDRLVSVQTDVAGTVEIHNVVMDGGVMHMMPRHDGVEVPAHGELVLEPNGYHVMLIGLTQSLLAGDEFSATLTFENAGDVEITVPIFMSEPGADELTAEPVTVGDLEISGVWARQAPKLDDTAGMGTAMASPMADCPVDGGMDHGQGMHGDCPKLTGTPMAGEAQGMSTGAFYLTIANTGAEADRLLSVSTDAAETAEVHNVVMDGGVMQMVPQFDGVEVPDGGDLVMESGSYHVMMIGLTESLMAGDEFTATLTFANAGEVEVTVLVFVGEPNADELKAEPVIAGELEISGLWARQAPKIESDSGTTTMPMDATAEVTPAS